jgi:energy-coupling factor transporter ATP-binding protein EcfA2
MEFYFSKTKAVTDLPGVHLVQDNVWSKYNSPWDDFGFIVTFQVLLVKEEKLLALGEVKVLIKGIQDTSAFFIASGALVLGTKSYKISSVLEPDKVVSLGTSIDHYQKVKNAFPADAVESYLSGICDAGYFYSRYEIYRVWPGFDSTLLRDGQPAEARIKKGYSIAFGNHSPEDEISILIDTIPGSFEPIEFRFDNGKDVGSNNLNLIIGANGAGKSHILKYVTELITGVAEGKERWPYFHKLVVVAYSPFEKFYTDSEISEALLKKQTPEALKSRQLPVNQKKRLLKINKYSYIGFRNESNKFNLDWPKEHSARSVLKIMQYDQDNWWSSQHRVSLLVSTLKMSVGFDALALRTKDGEFIKITDEYGVSVEEIEKTIDVKSGIFFLKGDKELPLSSGQIMYSYMIPALAAEIEDESLIILDEPELYLHPSLEVGLISMLKSLMQETSSYAIIATHSAILAREVSQDGIRILHSLPSGTVVTSPTFETYGESLDLILGAAFDDYETTKPFQKSLDKKIQEFKGVDDAMKALGENLGDDALGYIVSKFNGKETKVIFEDE